MTRLSPAMDRWLPLVLVVLTAAILGTLIVTVWPPFP